MSYIKAVDWYLIVSFLFVFAVLLEYTVVLYLTDKEKQEDQRKRIKKSRNKTKVSWCSKLKNSEHIDKY